MTVPAPDIEFAVTDIPCGFHQGAADYYSWNGVTVSTGSVPEFSRPLFVTRGRLRRIYFLHVINIDMYQTLAFAVGVLFIGGFLKRR